MGAYSRTTATGWQGDKIVFTGDMSMGGKSMNGPRHLHQGRRRLPEARLEAEIDGKWTVRGSETCKKAAGDSPAN